MVPLVRSQAVGTCWKYRDSGCCSIAACFRDVETKRSVETATWHLNRNPLAPSCCRTPMSTIRVRFRCCHGRAFLEKSTSPEHRPISRAIMLEDSARVQENDCRYVNKQERRRGKTCIRPFYDGDDVRKIVKKFEGERYGDQLKIAPRITASFHDAGHILGSAAVRVKYTARGNTTTVLFSGDLGRSHMPILRDPEPPPPCDVLILESTYGDRLHEQVGEEMKKKAQDLLDHARTHKSKIIVPAFAVGRTQELVMRIKELVGEGRVDPVPIYIDSPLADKATEVFKRHPECYDDETMKTFSSGGDVFASRYIRFVSSAEDSKRLNAMRGPCVIISSSGMCEGGRVIHHLKHAIQDEANIIVFVGFQAEHTLGRKLVEGWDVVPIFGVPTPRRAQIVKFERPVGPCRPERSPERTSEPFNPPPSTIFIVHGEEKQALSLGSGDPSGTSDDRCADSSSGQYA